MMVHGVQHVLQGKNWAVHICSVPINKWIMKYPLLP